MNKHLLAMLVLLIAASGPVHAADLSANVGFNSDYIFRGVKLSPSSANGGVDLTAGGWYVGTWLADVDVDTDHTSIVLEITRSFGVWSSK